MVVRRRRGLRRLALFPILRTASKLCLLCIVLGVRRILLGLLLGRFLGSGSILPGSGDAPAQGPEAGRGLPLHVAYPGGLRGRGECPRREALVSIGLGASARNAPMSRLSHLPARA